MRLPQRFCLRRGRLSKRRLNDLHPVRGSVLSVALGSIFFSYREEKIHHEHTETTEKSTSARASRDCEITVP